MAGRGIPGEETCTLITGKDDRWAFCERGLSIFLHALHTSVPLMEEAGRTSPSSTLTICPFVYLICLLPEAETIFWMRPGADKLTLAAAPSVPRLSQQRALCIDPQTHVANAICSSQTETEHFDVFDCRRQKKRTLRLT